MKDIYMALAPAVFGWGIVIVVIYRYVLFDVATDISKVFAAVMGAIFLTLVTAIAAAVVDW